jgi:CBS domain-containing protein
MGQLIALGGRSAHCGARDSPPGMAACSRSWRECIERARLSAAVLARPLLLSSQSIVGPCPTRAVHSSSRSYSDRQALLAHTSSTMVRIAEATVDDLLAAFARTSADTHRISASATLADALSALVVRRVGVLIAEDDVTGRFMGLVTARDVLRAIHDRSPCAETLASEVKSLLIPPSRVIAVAPEEHLARVSTIMSQARVRALPVIQRGMFGTEVVGVVTLKDVSDYLNLQVDVGKDAFSRNVLPRLGIAEGAMLSQPLDDYATDEDLAASSSPIAFPLPASADGQWVQLRTGAAFAAKRPRKQGDPLLPCEDAHFVMRVAWPADSDSSARGHPGGLDEGGGAVAPVTYFGVIDGVGSWQERGISPTAFSSALRDVAVDAVIKSVGGYLVGAKADPNLARRASVVTPPSPMQVLSEAWYETVMKHHIIGSATMLVGTIDPLSGQLAMANVGDCGVIVIRPAADATSGSLAAGAGTVLEQGVVPLAVAFRSPQQLHDFNLPHQLGFVPQSEDAPTVCQEGVFETPKDADFMRVPVIPGDIVVAASDG